MVRVSAVVDVLRTAGDSTKCVIILHPFCFHLLRSSQPPSLHLSVNVSILFSPRLGHNHGALSARGIQCKSVKVKSGENEKWNRQFPKMTAIYEDISGIVFTRSK